jgi:hypothetical protein
MDIQYAQVAVYTSDFAFQVMESKQKQPKYEMTLIVDVDINFKRIHEHGSVNTMKDEDMTCIV